MNFSFYFSDIIHIDAFPGRQSVQSSEIVTVQFYDDENVSFRRVRMV
jgi:hypothetical protein